MDGGLLSLKWNNHKTTFFHVLSNIRKKEAYCDATLACDGRFYPVHKLILSTCSDYFEQMFEKTKDKQPVIVLKDIRHEDLEALLNYMYLGEVNVLQNDLSGLIKSAECLRIKGLAVPDEDPNDKKDNINKRLWEGDSISDGKRQRREERDRLEERREEKRREERREERRQEFSSSRENINRKETPRETPREQVRETHREQVRETHREQVRETHREQVRETHRTDPISVASSPSQSLSSIRSPENNRNAVSEPPVESRRQSIQDTSGVKSNDVPDDSANSLQAVVIDDDDDDQPTVKEEPRDGYVESDYPEVLDDDKESLQASFEQGGDPQQSLVQDIASLAQGFDGKGFDGRHPMRAGQPQSMEDLVAQVMPGSSGMQNKTWGDESNLDHSLLGMSYSEGLSDDGQQRTAPMGSSVGAGGVRTAWGLGDDVVRTSVEMENQGVGTSIEMACMVDGRLNYSCSFCGYTTRDKTKFRKHLYTHTGEKPYACNFCSYKTTQNSNLRTHLRRHHQQGSLEWEDNIHNQQSSMF